ncbi:MAG: N-acetyltransferase [Clostridia bacterium]|nr:N-acetyltransferase [Clostridia bacterium]
MVEVKAVSDRKGIRTFVEYPQKLYAGNPNYVPDLIASRMEDFDREKNPAFEYCDAQCFLAYRDGKVVGRIAAIHNTKANQKFGKNYLTLSSIDFIDDDEVVDALFNEAFKWGREKHGCTHVHGPLGFSDMDPEGMLIEGFDRRGLFYTYYNYPYYAEQMQRAGFSKEVDWVECRVTIPEERIPRLQKISNEVMRRRKLHIVELRSPEKPIRQLAEDVFNLWNETYKVLFGVVPMTRRQVEKYVAEFLPLLNNRTTVFVYNEAEEIVGFGICSPALEEAQRRNKGRMFPFGWIPMLRALKGKNDTVDLLLIGVRPDLQMSGINAIIIDNLHEKMIQNGVKYAETGPMLELNDKVQAQLKSFPHEQHKRRRCWVRDL